jgi:hypothetical protein
MIGAEAARARLQEDPQERVGRVDWDRVEAELDARGFAVVDELLSPAQCRAVTELFPDDSRFRKHVVMAQHGYGCGEYKYFAYPLPDLIAGMREAAYPRLSRVANRWNEELGIATRYPVKLGEFLKRCHDAGQTRPTPLLLQYGPGDYNRLHQDLYGEHAFPLQMATLLSRPGEEFTGGEFVLTEQRPRMQSRVTVVPLGQGDAVIFAVHHRGSRSARLLPGQSQAWRQRCAERPPLHSRHHFS